jgi:hypothetical protein
MYQTARPKFHNYKKTVIYELKPSLTKWPDTCLPVSVIFMVVPDPAVTLA